MTEVKSEYGNPELAYLFGEENLNDSERIRKNVIPFGYDDEHVKMYEQYEMSVLTPGKVIEATLVGESKDDFLFSANAKDYIRVSKNSSEFTFIKGHEFGDIFDVAIVSIKDDPFWVKGSVASLHEANAHQELKELDSDQCVEALVSDLTSAGYTMVISHNGVSLEAFMPHTLAGINKLHDRARELLVGKTLNVMIESFADDKGTYIVSRRKYLKTLMPQEIKKLESDVVYKGHVTGTTPFGVFVEFNECLTGMIHKSNIHPDWQEKIQEIVPGTPIEFYVKEIVKNKIILTQIQKESLWDTINIGDSMQGIVRDSKNFGVLVSLDDETIGLVHTSELEKYGNNKSYESGSEVKVTVLAVDRLNRKIFLSFN